MQYSLHHHKPNLREYIFFGPCIEIEYLCHIAILVWISKNLQNWRNWAKMIHQENIHNFLHHFHQHSQMYLQFMTGLRTKIKIITNLAFFFQKWPTFHEILLLCELRTQCDGPSFQQKTLMEQDNKGVSIKRTHDLVTYHHISIHYGYIFHPHIETIGLNCNKHLFFVR